MMSAVVAPSDDLALGTVGILPAQHGGNVLQAETIAVELGRIHVHPHCRQGTTPNAHLPDALNLGKTLLHDGGGGVVQRSAVVHIGRKRQNHDRRIRRVDLAISGIAGEIRGQVTARGIDRGLDVARGSINVAVQIKLQRDAGGAEITGRRHFRDAGNSPELALQGSGDGGGHDLGTGSRQTGANRNRGEIDLRKRRDRQLPEGHGARQRNGRGQEGSGDGPPNKWRREAHAHQSAGTASGPASGARREE